MPVVLILLVVMLLGSLYLIKSSNSTSMTTSNLAYESAQSKAVDYGLLIGTNWLNANAGALDADSKNNGYVASLDTTKGVASKEFWDGSVKIDNPADPLGADGKQIEYVIHRMCLLPGPFDQVAPANSCVQTESNPSVMGNGAPPGQSQASDGIILPGPPQLHYVVTARLNGARGGNVINQVVVLIGA